MKSKTLLAAIVVLATTATTLSIIAAVPVAFADESETETEQNDEDEVIQSGFLNELTVQKCKALASGACATAGMVVNNAP